jgi:hypothetical protein
LRRFRVPEIALGALLAVAIFATSAAVQIINPKDHNQSAQAADGAPKGPTSSGSVSADERVAEYTEGLAWATVLLAIVTLGVLIATWRASVRQSKDMKAALGLAERQFEHLKGKELQAFLDRAEDLRRLGEQIKVGREGAEAAKKAAEASAAHAKVAEVALTQLERPYVFIFDVKEFGFDPETAEFFVEYSVANYGKMPAIIEGAYVGFEFSDRGAPPEPTLVEDSHTLMTAPILQAGERREKIREYLPNSMTTGDIEIDVTNAKDPFGITAKTGPVFDVPKGDDVFLRAIIEYRGPFSRGHSTGALWLANYPAKGQLAQRGGDEYNYVK